MLHEGKPLAGAEGAFAAVDEGLLALRPNDSWDLLNAMVRQRGWGVETSTGQSEIIGRRHYGRKAVAAGGGGGKNATRELFDTLLLWKDRVQLDAQGEALIDVPLNDSLTSFRLVAMADAGAQQFGRGTRAFAHPDLQVLAGLPPLVRDGDRFAAMLTLRNTTSREMKVRATLQGAANSGAEITRVPLAFAPQDVVVAAGGAKEITWGVAVPAAAYSVTWEAAAEELGGMAGQEKATDRVKLTQLVSPAVPCVAAGDLQQLDAGDRSVAAPVDACPNGWEAGWHSAGRQPRSAARCPA